MNNMLTMSKKALTWSVVVSAILWSMSAAFVVAPLTAKAATSLVAGDLIRGTVKSPYGGYPVFFYGVDGKKSLFSTEATYKTWYSDFSKVKVLPESELQAISGSDKNVTYRPGAMVVKFESESNLYVVEKGAMIRKVSDAVAKELYGATYVASQVPSAFRANYKSGTDVAVAADYNKVAAMAASPDISTDMGGPSVVAPVGAVTVSLASDNPAGSVLPQKAAGVTLMKVNLSSGSGAVVSGVTIKRVGVGAAADFLNLYLYDGAKRLTTGRSIQSTSNEAQFTNINLNVAAGTTKTLSLVGDVASTTQNATISGDTHGFSVTTVVSTAAVSGTPVTGSTFSIGSQAVSTLTVFKGSTPANPTVGTKGATISEFKLQAGTNDVKVSRVALIQAGNIPNSDLSNLELWQGGAKVASVAAMDGDKIRFVLDAPMTIPQGSTRVFNVKADVSGYGSRTIKTYVEYAADVYAMDVTYNFGAFVDLATSGTFDGSSTNFITLTTQGGKATVAFNGPSASDISVGTQDALLYKFALVAGDQALDIRNVRVLLTGNANIYASGVALFTDISLKNMDTGSRIDTKELTTNNSATETLVFNNSFIIPAGTTVNLGVTADVKNVTTFSGQTITVTLKNMTTNSGDVKEVNTNQNVTDIVPSADIAGYAQTIRSSALTVQVASTPVDNTAVKGAKGIEAVGYSFAAGSQSDVKVTALTLTGAAAFNNGSILPASVDDVVLSAALWDGATQVGTAKSPSSTGTLTFDNLNWTVPAGQTKKLALKIDLATSITGLDTYNAVVAFGIAQVGSTTTTTSDLSAQDKDSNTVNATDGTSDWTTPVNGYTTHGGVEVTVTNSGTLTMDVDGDTAKSNIIVGGSLDVPMAKFKFAATNEAFLVKKLRISNDSSGDDTGITQLKLTYPKQDGTMETKTAFLSAGVADVSDLNFYVPVNKNVVLAVSADLGAITATGVSGDTPTMRVDFNGAFEAVGAQSGATLNEGSDVHATTLMTTNCSDGSGVNYSAGVSGCYADDAATATGNEMIVRKTKPTVTLAANSPSGASVPGLNEGLRFTVSADAAGDVTLNTITFKVTSTDNAGTPTNWNKCDTDAGSDFGIGEFTLYESTDLTNAISATKVGYLLSGAVCDTTATKLGFVQFHSMTNTVAAGTSKTYVLKVDTTGASSAADDTVRFDVLEENGASSTLGATSEFMYDETGSGAAANITGASVKNLPVTGGTIIY